VTDAEVFGGAALVGAVAGMRSMSAPAVVSQLARLGGSGLSDSKLAWLGSPKSIYTTGAMALGEIIADKLPFIPARTKAGPLVARAVSGGFSGAAIAASKKRSRWLGALCGAAGAIGATYAFYHLRRAATENLNVPNPVAAVVEDVVVAGTAYLLISKLRERDFKV